MLLGFLRTSGESLNIFFRAFHSAAAFQISLPLRSLRERFGRVLIERLGHQSDQVIDDPRVFNQRFDYRMRKFSLN